MDKNAIGNLNLALGATAQTENIEMEPPHRRRELRYMKRLGQRHMAGWPSKRDYPRFKV